MSVNMPNVPQSPDLFTTNPAFETSGLTSSELMDMAIQRQPDIRTMNHYLGSITEAIPRGDVLSEIADAIMTMSKVIGEIEALLDITYLDSSLSPDLEEAHNQVWSEVVNVAKTEVSDVITISQKAAPNYISYQEYLYAVEHQCRGCRALVMEYDAYVGKTALSFYYDIKTFVSYMHYEMLRMNNVMLYTIGDEYDDDTEKKVAKEFYQWAKTCKEYTKLFAREIFSGPPELPQSEVDNVTEIQAAQFEAFFSIRINSYQSETKKLLGLAKREMVDTCDMYYDNFLSPAIKSRSLVAYPLELSLLSSSMRTKSPNLAKEVVIAASSINGNLASLLADLRDKRINADKKISGILAMIREKRRYISYTRQLKFVSGTKSERYFIDIPYDEYAVYFEQSSVNNEKHETLNSSHKYFTDLLEDNHPQYLLRSGGVITGDITMSQGSTIGGLDLANHNHSAGDGSSVIRASSINYSQDRIDRQFLENFTDPDNPVAISVEAYNPSILTGGVPVVDVIISARLDLESTTQIDDERFDILVEYVELED